MLRLKENLFVVEVLKTDGNWSGKIRISTRKEWEKTSQKHVEKYVQYLDGMELETNSHFS